MGKLILIFDTKLNYVLLNPNKMGWSQRVDAALKAQGEAIEALKKEVEALKSKKSTKTTKATKGK